jgi:hypothetical protein
MRHKASYRRISGSNIKRILAVMIGVRLGLMSRRVNGRLSDTRGAYSPPSITILR